MKIEVSSQYEELIPGVLQLAAQLRELDFSAGTWWDTQVKLSEPALCLELVPDENHLPDNPNQEKAGRTHSYLSCADPTTLLERALGLLPLDFEKLPLLAQGESKELRLWTDKLVVIRFKPTVYSFTINRSGEAPGTETDRARFSAEIFRRLARLVEGQDGVRFTSAFLAALDTPQGMLLVQRRVEVSNLEVRVKRYHIGSPLHRYLYTEKYPTVQQDSAPLRRWTRLDQPVVCFDWRHPLQDEQGTRLADEPLSDDYAGVWMENVAYAKRLARQTFLWLEELFAGAGICLVDLCLMIDRTGRVLFGEISPDCMRVRFNLHHPELAEAGAKDIWRAGGSPEQLHRHYQELYQRLFERECVTV